jgi:hypothetical protein
MTQMSSKTQVVALLIGIAASAAPALAQERVIGLLDLPEVFGRGACDRYTPQPVALRATPLGQVVGSVVVVKPWTFAAGGGCEGLEVGVRMAPAATVQPLPTMEYGYEEPGVVVLERRDRWFRVRLDAGSAWLEASAQDEFYDLERLYDHSLTYLTDAWSGQVAAAPGMVGRVVQFPGLAAGQSVRVRRTSREDGGLWFLVDILSRSPCAGDAEPTVADRGWVRAYGKGGEPTIWFSSRGC